MNRALLKKCLSESRGLLLACAAALYAFCWVRVWIVSQFDMHRFQTILEQFREFERFSPVPFDQLLTYAGRVALTYDEPIVVTCMSVWAISRGSDCISGELGRGTMEMLLAQPVSRMQVLCSQAAVTIGGVVLLAAMTWLGVYTGIMTNTIKEAAPTPTFTIPWLDITLRNPLAERPTLIVPMAERVDPQLLVPAAVNLGALGFFLAGFSTLMSSWDRYRWRTIGLVVGVYITQMIIKIVGLASERFSWFRYCTFFTAYEPEAFVRTAMREPDHVWSIAIVDPAGRFVELAPFGYDLLLIALGGLAYLLAALIFNRRDLPAPL
jgi:ABC-2 type transport system permease protein